MIIIYLSQHPGVTLLLGYLLGAADMLLLAVACTRLVKAREYRRTHDARAQRDAKARQALQLQQKPAAIDEARMTCVICWENRHPGRCWPFRHSTLCREHLRVGLSAAAAHYDREVAIAHS